MTSGHLSTFPIPVVCPRCYASLALEHSCCCAERPVIGDYKGIPQLLFGQKYWGETSSANMASILELTEKMHWEAALRSVIGTAPLYAHLTTPIRADFLHAMPWNTIKTVLDVGAGMGFMACDLAAYAHTVIAVEAVPERAEFIRIRARQDGLDVHPIIANAMQLPFAPETFDLITLNGVFEYIGLWSDKDPKRAQGDFLRNVLRYLRPGGYLYVGIETRYGWGLWLGARDHSGLAFTSLFPRFLADLYCRLRQHPFYGAEHTIKGYRTYTHTPRQYRLMFEQAGFRLVDVLGVFAGYNDQKLIYDINDFRGRKYSQLRFNPPASALGRLRRRIVDSRLLYKFFEPEVLIFARKVQADSASRLLWEELIGSNPSETVVQVNTGTKTLALTFRNGVPRQIFEAAKLTMKSATQRVARAYETVTQLQALYRTEVDSWPIRWPAPLGFKDIAGRRFYGYEFIEGKKFSTLTLPRYFNANSVLPLFTHVLKSYADFCGRLSSRWPRLSDACPWGYWRARFESADVDEHLKSSALEALSFAQERRWLLSAMHGDLSASNLIVAPAGQIVMIDWEHFSPAFLPAVDLVRFGFDVMGDGALLATIQRNALHDHVRQTLGSLLKDQGIQKADYTKLHALFLIHQMVSVGIPSSRNAALASRYALDGENCPL